MFAKLKWKKPTHITQSLASTRTHNSRRSSPCMWSGIRAARAVRDHAMKHKNERNKTHKQWMIASICSVSNVMQMDTVYIFCMDEHSISASCFMQYENIEFYTLDRSFNAQRHKHTAVPSVFTQPHIHPWNALAHRALFNSAAATQFWNRVSYNIRTLTSVQLDCLNCVLRRY